MQAWENFQTWPQRLADTQKPDIVTVHRCWHQRNILFWSIITTLTADSKTIVISSISWRKITLSCCTSWFWLTHQGSIGSSYLCMFPLPWVGNGDQKYPLMMVHIRKCGIFASDRTGLFLFFSRPRTEVIHLQPPCRFLRGHLPRQIAIGLTHLSGLPPQQKQLSPTLLVGIPMVLKSV